MTDCRVIFAAALVMSCATLPLAAQAPSAPVRKGPGGTAGKTIRPGPALLPTPQPPVSQTAPAAVPPTNPPPASPPQSVPGPTATPRSGVTQPQGIVTPQAVATPPTAPATPAASTGALTAGLGLQPFAGSEEVARFDYARTLVRNLDSASVSLVSLFRGTSGQPNAGATEPATLSTRERERWTRCRDLYWDFTTFAAGAQSIRAGVPPTSPLYRATAALDTALDDIEALAECDNIASMISAPDRWTPWAEQYTNAARHFYADWYAQMREAHEKARAVVIALNAAPPPGRAAVPIPPGLPRTPPYAGAVVR
jgi:hypothetical protein